MLAHLVPYPFSPSPAHQNRDVVVSGVVESATAHELTSATTALVQHQEEMLELPQAPIYSTIMGHMPVQRKIGRSSSSPSSSSYKGHRHSLYPNLSGLLPL